MINVHFLIAVYMNKYDFYKKAMLNESTDELL